MRVGVTYALRFSRKGCLHRILCPELGAMAIWIYEGSSAEILLAVILGRDAQRWRCEIPVPLLHTFVSVEILYFLVALRQGA